MMMSKLSKRAHLLLGVAIGLALVGVWYLSGHLWWVEGEGYCLGTLLECYGPEFH